VRTADIIIAAGGGAGTLSEIAFAWQLDKKVLCVTLFDGWAKELAGRNLDERKTDLLIPVSSIEEINQLLNQLQ
jgi:predicted Rossmann-fold nucleotide-binding protein